MKKISPTKRQHFVPRFYLKHFARSGTEQVLCAKVEPYRYIGPAGIGSQCQEDYFYGNDGVIENLLQEDESEIAPVLADVVRGAKITSQNLGALQLLAVTLKARTRKFADSAKLAPLRFGLEFVRHGLQSGKLPQPKGGWRDDMLDFRGISGVLLAASFKGWFEMQTLRFKLLQADPSCAFVTSDNPAVALNQFTAGVTNRSFVGFSRSGFQLLLPISPSLCLFFFDPQVYKVKDFAQQKTIISGDDVHLINGLQVQSAENCIYCNELISEEYVKALVDEHISLRSPITNDLRILPGRSDNEKILHIRMANPQPKHPWSFCWKFSPPKSTIGDYRDRGWTAQIDAIFEESRKDRRSNPLQEKKAS